MKGSHVRHLFNEPGDRERVRAELTRVTDGRIEALLEEERFAPWEDAT